ncbi:hypothetical protein GH839_29860, partial [Bacillus thuringiensis]|nr:hypothetical protein [Bacillus thuringiensis]
MGNELLSILENAGRMGIPLPQPLTSAVEILGGKSKQNKDAFSTPGFSASERP